jgi:hypothetical protein
VDGGTVYLKAGTHTFTSLVWPMQGAANPTAWLTITAAPGVAKADVILQGSTDTSNSQGNLLLMRLKGLTISEANGANPVYSGNDGARLWYDGCTIDGGDRTTAPTYQWNSSGFNGGKYMTDCLVTNTYTVADGGASILRGVTGDTYVGDAFSDCPLVLNCTAKNQNTSATGAHADIGQYLGAWENVIWQNVTATDSIVDSQGLFIGVNQSMSNSAIVDCNITGQGSGALAMTGSAENLYVKNTAFTGGFASTGTFTNCVFDSVTFDGSAPSPVTGVTIR